MRKIIIKNQTDISNIDVLEFVKSVISIGRISNGGKQYCYITGFNIDGKEYNIATDLRKCSDVFTFYKS